MPAPDRHRHRALRLITVVLLLGAAGCFGVGMVRISFSPGFVSETQQYPGLGTLPAACVSGGIATYSGLALAAGGAPSVNPGCLTQIRDPGQAGLGIQPLALLALVAVLAAAALTVGGWRLHRPAGVLLCLLAGGLLALNAANLGQVFAGHFGHATTAIASGPDLGLWVVSGLLLLVILVQLGSAALGWARRALAPLEATTGG